MRRDTLQDIIARGSMACMECKETTSLVRITGTQRFLDSLGVLEESIEVEVISRPMVALIPGSGIRTFSGRVRFVCPNDHTLEVAE